MLKVLFNEFLKKPKLQPRKGRRLAKVIPKFSLSA